MTDTDAATRDRLVALVDPFPMDLNASLAGVRARHLRRHPKGWPIAAGALTMAAAAIAFLVWTFVRHDVRPATPGMVERVAFVDQADPTFRPVQGAFTQTRIFEMNPDGTEVRQLTSGAHFDFHPSWSPDGSRLAFIRYEDFDGPSNLFVVRGDGTGLREITFCGTFHCIGGMAWSPRGDWIAYVAHSDLNLVRPDGTDNHSISHCLQCSFGGLAWSPDASRIALTTGDSSGSEIARLLIVTVGDPQSRDFRTARPILLCTRSQNACLSGAQSASGPNWSPDGQWIAFTRVNRIFLIRPDGTDLHLLSGCSAPVVLGKKTNCRAFNPSWSPDGSKIAFDSAPGLFVMDADGTGVVRLRNSGESPSWHMARLPSPAPPKENGTLVFERIASCGFGACSGDRPDPAIVVANPDGSNARAIGRGTEPAASPEGTRIAFKGMDGDLYVMDADGHGVTRIFNCRAPDCHGMNDPTWSQDGKRIAFAGAIRRGRGFLREIYTINADGTGLRRVTTCIAPECSEHVSPSFSPDGQSIAFEADVRPEGSPVYETRVQSLDLGTGQIQTVYHCTSECSFQGGLEWSLDGRSIVYGLGSGLFVASLDGSPIRQLTADPQDVFPSWSPDGRLIGFTWYPDRSTGGIYVVDVESGQVTAVIPGGSRRWSYLFPTWEPRWTFTADTPRVGASRG